MRKDCPEIQREVFPMFKPAWRWILHRTSAMFGALDCARSFTYFVSNHSYNTSREVPLSLSCRWRHKLTKFRPLARNYEVPGNGVIVTGDDFECFLCLEPVWITQVKFFPLEKNAKSGILERCWRMFLWAGDALPLPGYLPKGCLLCLLLKIRVHHLPCVYTILQRQVVQSFDKHWVLNLYNEVQAEQELPSLGNFLPKLRMALHSQQMCLVPKQPPSPIFWLCPLGTAQAWLLDCHPGLSQLRL